MTPDEFIDNAIQRGETHGINELDKLARRVFIVSELEVSCAINGIDSFISRYGIDGLTESSIAFREMGVVELADTLLTCTLAPSELQDSLLNRANDLVNNHVGWDYHSISEFVSKHLS